MKKILLLKARLRAAIERGESEVEISRIIGKLDAERERASGMQSMLPPLHDDTDKPELFHVHPPAEESSGSAPRRKSNRSQLPYLGTVPRTLHESPRQPHERALNGYDRPFRIDPYDNPEARMPRLAPLEQEPKPPVGVSNGYDRPFRIDPYDNPEARMPRLAPLEREPEPPVGALNGYNRPFRIDPYDNPEERMPGFAPIFREEYNRRP
jgi:hypothetical protein